MTVLSAYGLRKYYPNYHDTFAERKAERTEHYFRHIFKNKMEVCTACSGSGYYDHNGSPDCGACDGKGKVRERD
ncbi:hypothetical protein SIPHO049v1_p0030 [Vibrio phage PS14A.1]|nr:hypothetical protein SIPHO049v1_p0030 [Vibrio phage PS14A.1]